MKVEITREDYINTVDAKTGRGKTFDLLSEISNQITSKPCDLHTRNLADLQAKIGGEDWIMLRVKRPEISKKQMASILAALIALGSAVGKYVEAF